MEQADSTDRSRECHAQVTTRSPWDSDIPATPGRTAPQTPQKTGPKVPSVDPWGRYRGRAGGAGEAVRRRAW